MLILSHRGNISGHGTIDFDECANRGFGVELDLRFDEEWKSFYFSHDKTGYSSSTDACHILFKLHRVAKAINIKETGQEESAVRLLQYHRDLFAFDFELCDADPLAYEKLTRAARMSDRRSERSPQFEAPIIWLDEFNSWVMKNDVARLVNKKVYWVSPELHKPRMSIALIKDRWHEAVYWEVDGICTDYPDQLEMFLQQKICQEERFLALSEAPIG